MRIAALLGSLALLGCGPMGHTPGIRLGGNEVPTPESFSFLQDDHPEIQLAAQGTLLPRVVNLWAVGDDEGIYVAGRRESGWVKRLGERPDEVRVRVGDDAYALHSMLLADVAARQRAFDGFVAKYGAEAVNASVGHTAAAEDFEMIFKLTPR